MSSDVHSTIHGYIQQEMSLLNQFSQVRRQKTDLGAEIGKTLVGELGAAIAGDIFESNRAEKYGRKMTKAYLNQQQKDSIISQINTINAQHDSIVSNARDFMSNVSERRPNISQPNSHTLVNKINRAQEYTKVNTKIRRTISALQIIASKQLIFNTEIPKIIEEKPVTKVGFAPHAVLKNLESKLRTQIQTKLQSISKNWWKERIPIDVREQAENKKNRNEKPWPWHEQKDLHPIYYIDFADYSKIIKRKDNWEQVFKTVFKDKEIITWKLRELEPIRNAISHSRELTTLENERLKLFSGDILACLQLKM